MRHRGFPTQAIIGVIVVNVPVSEGITSLATVHDSFGCLPSQAKRFREIIREQFVKMYQDYDVLAEVFERARADLKDKTLLPETPSKWYGTLNIEDVLDAEYEFA